MARANDLKEIYRISQPGSAKHLKKPANREKSTKMIYAIITRMYKKDIVP